MTTNESVALDFLTDFSKDIGKLLVSNKHSDVIIQTGEEPNTKEFQTHSLILSARSPKFEKELWETKLNNVIYDTDYKSKEGDKDVVVLKISHISSNIFEIILKYIYTAMIDLDTIDGMDILSLSIAAEYLEIEKLINHIRSHITDKPAQFLQKDSVKILETVFFNESYISLQEICLNAICYDPTIIFDSSEFLSLDKKIIIKLIEHDNLFLEEIKIWQYLLNWSISRESLLPISKEIKWTQTDFSNIKNQMEDFIPLIRWFQIPSKQVWRNIRPYQQLIPKQLYQNIIGHHLDPKTPLTDSIILPKRKTVLNSNLIQNKHLELINGWICDKDDDANTKKESMPYNLLLLYRASRDGFKTSKFHSLCDKKGPTIFIAQLKETGKLIGGYNPFSLEPYNSLSGDNFKSTNKSFLFSFVSKNVTTFNIVRVTNESNAICYNLNKGPTFGGGNDLTIKDDYITISKPQSYSSFGPISTSQLVDYEVFKLVKK
ncbi:hypothetical protein RclHR1_17690005 [Rhizophagus clarus]|uniref:TLDc domain-containing protein n=1 Tax=Rhizophagus clarus TaxID=94130 RepID=A0A2Z6R117_9GLOM|nr:hypothetical protein RclHR1_17690005 [Rhizophagus clarus]